MCGSDCSARVEATFTIAPRAARSSGAQCLAIRNTPVRLVPMRRFHSASASCSSGPFAAPAMAALLTSASSRPKRAATSRTQASTDGSLETSQAMKSAPSAAECRSATATR